MNAASPRIPIVNVEAQHQKLRPEILRALRDVFDSRAYVQGPHVQAFETAFASEHGAAHAAGCSNGTAALSLALEAAGVGPGDEVITTSYTFVATAESILHLGATPVFVDIEPGTYNMDPSLVRQAVTQRTKAIVPVHLYGTPCAMDELREIANENDAVIVEDCAQAHLAKFEGQAVGTFGRAGSFSFYPGKNLGACGDAGMVVSEDENTISRVKKLLDHGRETKYLHDIVGYNRRMDAMQAAILGVKLRYLEEWTSRRRRKRGGVRQPAQAGRIPGDRASRQHGTRLSSIRRSSGQSRGNHGSARSERDRLRHPLSDPSPPAAIHVGTGIQGRLAARNGNGRRPGPQPADVCGALTRTNRSGLRRVRGRRAAVTGDLEPYRESRR